MRRKIGKFRMVVLAFRVIVLIVIAKNAQSKENLKSMRVLCLIMLMFVGLACFEAEGADRLPTAGTRGSTVPSFQMRTVSGPLMNRSVCHVCRNGDRPVVMVVLRELGPAQRVLLKNLDRAIEEHRTQGLRAFSVFLSEIPRRDISRVQTFQYNGRVAMPIGLCPEAVGVDQLGVSDEIPVSVILYEDQTVKKRFDFSKAGPSHKEIREVLKSIESFVEQSAGDE